MRKQLSTNQKEWVISSLGARQCDLEGVFFGRVVGDERRGAIRGIGKRRRENATLGRVEVAPTRVDI
jgi:hypothetical protein